MELTCRRRSPLVQPPDHLLLARDILMEEHVHCHLKNSQILSKPTFLFQFQQNHLIRGHGDELDVAVDILGLGNHPVLVGDPVAVLLHILLHPVVLRVEDVAAISEHM